MAEAALWLRIHKYVTVLHPGALQARSQPSSHTGEKSDDPVLDAKLDLMLLRLRFTEQHPEVAEAKARFDVLSKTIPAVSLLEYRSHLEERLARAQVENAELSLHFTEQHPKRVFMAEKLKFLQQELQRTQSSQ